VERFVTQENTMTNPVDLRSNVREFHRVVVGGELPTSLGVPAESIARRRMRLIAEEFFEVLRSVFGPEATLAVCEEKIEEVIKSHPLHVNLAAFAQELADLEYVCEGAFLGFGIDSRPVHTEIQRANMAKKGGPMRPDGKRLKPPGWTPPDIQSILNRQTRVRESPSE
jgi:predicted HAD superfamily Cof-like phosphohydrolase